MAESIILSASIDMSFSGNFDKTCCKPQVGLGIQVCAQVLGIIGFTREEHRHCNLLNAAVAITRSNEFDSHCCQDNTPLLGGLNLFDPLLPDCITFDPNSPRSCSEANQLPGCACSTNHKYGTNSNDAVVANLGEFSTTCCKQNCLTQTKEEYTIEVYRTCQASHSGIL
ncbi:hypothetical protein SARC_03610 [Sphaeroforma arctica JP610]|uniref:Uncharacterized protein n=1 Tax=Sphaeroforma arctica JP610 TaxID=667725 RepID=A0A0L0G5F4_9EUKA|nr:hypothetical protein SARC_03610 [Sphaeroforma arctica JP610]KNC84154.1 hypothetical protein SARC_03610 [Sphaeroforma arctica JP610]|eukprot:XP_014158056.1 hypothetical protein SARC_03610 [Sphaeroforma arctica JP610]